MSIYAFQGLQALVDTVAAYRPLIGQTVKVDQSRKHRGKIGTVKRHMLSRYGDTFRYGSDAAHLLRSAEGRRGYVVLVEMPDGQAFWIDADKIVVCVE